jgi:DNA-binding NarL/FixJ family response regulator
MLFPKTKILIIEDHPHYLSGLKNYISRNTKKTDIDCAITGTIAIEKACQNNFDVILVDLQLPDISGIEVIQNLKSKNVTSKFIVNSYNCGIIQLSKLLDIGVDGILQKGDDEREIISAIEQCKNNAKFYSTTIQNDIGKYHNEFKQCRFTDREIEIIKLIKKGTTTTQISNILFISESTINTHKRNIFDKLKVKNSMELIEFCNKNNMF